MNQDTSSHKILIIEDNPGDQLLIQDYLDEYFKSYNLDAATSFSKAKEILGNKNNYFDIILLDLSLPDLDGMALLDAMVPLASGIPLVILTGYTDISFSISTLGRGASDYLLKDELTAFSLYKSIIHNIERKKYILEIETSQKKYSDLFQLSPQPLIIYDIDTLSILDVNKASCTLYGYSMDEFLSLSLLDIRPKEGHSYLRYEVKKVINSDTSSQSYIGLFVHKKKNGDEFTVEVYSNPASHGSKKIRISLIIDVSEKTKYIEEIEDQNERLKDIAWTQSHVVRAPLARIMGLIDLISNTEVEVDEKEQNYIFKGVIDSANELDKIIMDISQKATSVSNE
jgi:PAS domain S-box-containing protein